jgi:hypothetical protein
LANNKKTGVPFAV